VSDREANGQRGKQPKASYQQSRLERACVGAKLTPQISDAELVNEHHRLEVAIYEVEEDLLLKEMRRFLREGTALPPPSLISKIKQLVRSAGDRLGVF